MNRYKVNASEAPDLPNRLGLTNQDAINEEELLGFLRAEETAIEELEEDTQFTLEYLYWLHKKALGHLYDFAGRLRTVDMSKDGFAFPSAHFLARNLTEFEATHLAPIDRGVWEDRDVLLTALASMHAELLYIHPFREGNGRVVRLFTKLIFLAKVDEEIDLDVFNQGDNTQRYIAAVQQAASGNYSLMQELFTEL